MPGTFFGLETARRGMKVHQLAQDTTGHNLANASTPGYTRQEAVITVTDPYSNPTMDSSVLPGQIGSGVEVNLIRRIKDEYLDYNVRRTATDTAYWEEQIAVLQQAEASFAEPASSGIADRIVDFFKAWQELNNTPQDPGLKASVVQLGDELASLLSYTYNQIGDVRDSVAVIDDTPAVAGGKLTDQLARANDILVQIRDLTTSIEVIYSLNQQPNDLLDKRDVLLEELSKFGPVEVVFEAVNGKPTGAMSTFTLFGADMREAAGSTLSLEVSGEEIILTAYGGTEVINLTAHCHDTSRGGLLLGLERTRQNIEGYMSMLNELAVSMRDMILEKNNAPPPAAHPDFFTGDLVSGNFKVDSVLLSNQTLLDGTKARDIANLRDAEIDPVHLPYTFQEYYSLVVARVGSDVKSADSMAVNQAAIRAQVTGLRDAVSGVSIDEELTRMMQYQYGFQASAKVVSTLDSMLDTLINGLF